MISVTFQFETLTQVSNALALLQGDGTVQAIVEATQSADPKPVKAAPSAKVEAAPAVGGTPSPTADIPYDQVSKAITDKVKVDKDHVVAVLAKFGAKKGPELKPEQYADFLEAL